MVANWEKSQSTAKAVSILGKTMTTLVPAFEIFTSGIVGDFNIYANLEEITKLLENVYAINLNIILAWDGKPFEIEMLYAEDGTFIYAINGDGISYFIRKFGVSLMKEKPPTVIKNSVINFSNF